MRGVGASKYDFKRIEPAKLDGLLQRISSSLIRAPHRSLGNAIETALADLGDSLAADRVLVARRDSNGVAAHYVWRRRGTIDGAQRHDALDSLLGRLELGDMLVCGNRKEFPVAALRGATLPADISSAIFVPLEDGKAGSVLAVTGRTPRSWTAGVVKAIGW